MSSPSSQPTPHQFELLVNRCTELAKIQTTLARIVVKLAIAGTVVGLSLGTFCLWLTYHNHQQYLLIQELQEVVDGQTTDN